VSAPGVKFAIGSIASLCAVLVPRLLAALTVRDQADVIFISRDFAGLAVLFSALVGLVVAILEWRVPRAPRDTFMTTLGIPAILAGALSANQNTQALQQAAKTQGDLVNVLSGQAGISIEPAKAPGTAPGSQQGRLTDVLIPPLYAAGLQANSVTTAPTQFAISVNQPRYFIVLDRARTQQEAQARASQLAQRLSASAPGRPLALQVQRYADEFLVVVGGGARAKSDAVIEAVRVKNMYRVNLTLVEVPAAG
jgi:hypothetical protein